MTRARSSLDSNSRRLVPATSQACASTKPLQTTAPTPNNLWKSTGTHTANLWTSTGTLLATATFGNETASGWQQVNFATPVAVTPGTTYVASYHTSGNYSADPALFSSAVTNGPLTAPSSDSSGGNGVFAYGSDSLFPTNSFNSSSYGVDVLFRPQLAG